MREILLGQEEVNSDKPDTFGKTPLSRVAESRHERAAAQLQSRKAVPPVWFKL